GWVAAAFGSAGTLGFFAAGSADFCAGSGFATASPPPPFLIEPASSPLPRITAIGVLTATSVVPSGIKILPSVPSSTASTSIVALSVSISAITSPALTLSPSLLSHLARLPFSIVGDRAGISTWIGIEQRSSTHHFGSGHGRFRKPAAALRDHDLCVNVGVEFGGVRLGIVGGKL